MTQNELTEEEIWTTDKIITYDYENNGEGNLYWIKKPKHNEIVASLKAELAEKERKWQDVRRNDWLEYDKLRKQLAEKDNELEQIRTLKDTYIKDLAESIPKEKVQDFKEISRGTKCLGAYTGVKDCKGAYPNGYLNWLKKIGWWGEKRIHLCSGRVKDLEGFKVDIRPEMQPNLIIDARNTGLPSNNYDAVFIDPPYSKELAESLYGTEKVYAHINSFLIEGVRLAKPTGLIITLSYNIPKLQKECDLIAVWGIYEVPSVASMRCMCIFRKKELLSSGKEKKP